MFSPIAAETFFVPKSCFGNRYVYRGATIEMLLIETGAGYYDKRTTQNKYNKVNSFLRCPADFFNVYEMKIMRL